MVDTGVTGVEFTVINTDAQALSHFEGPVNCLPIGKDVTRGLGAGGIPVSLMGVVLVAYRIFSYSRPRLWCCIPDNECVNIFLNITVR